MFPYKITPIEGTIDEELLQQFKGQRNGFVMVGPKKWLLPKKYALHAEKYYSFDLRQDDLWILTHPRSGTTWMQEILWLINNDLDYESASKIPLVNRFPFFEFSTLLCEHYLQEVKKKNEDNPGGLEVISELNTPGYVFGQSMKSPRHLKSHLSLSLLPPSLLDTCKAVYVARNPYDVAASYYNHNKLLSACDFQGDFNKYWELFEKDLTIFSPYWEHVKEGWALRDHPNFLFLFYEDLIRDLPANIKKICKFLNKQMNEEQIQKLCEHVHIDNFRKNVPIINEKKVFGFRNDNAPNFIRRGKIGGNVEFEDNELKSKADKWYKENLAKTNIKFPKFE